MTNDNTNYEPGIYLTLEEIEKQAAKHKGNPIIQQLVFVTRQNHKFFNALMDCRDAALMTALTGHQSPRGALYDVYHTANRALEDATNTTSTPNG